MKLNFLGEKRKNIRFYHEIAYIREMFPVIPATNIEIPWRKKSIEASKNYREKADGYISSGALCLGIKNLISTSYIVTCPIDIKIKTFGDGEKYEWRIPSKAFVELTKLNPVTEFPAKQYGEYVNLPPNTLKTVIKIDTGWGYELPKGWAMFMSPISHYYDEPRFTAFTGVLDGIHSHTIGVPILWHTLKGEQVLKAGTPLCLLTPYKKEEIKFEISPMTKKDWKNAVQYDACMNSSYSMPSYVMLKAANKNLEKVK